MCMGVLPGITWMSGTGGGQSAGCPETGVNSCEPPRGSW